MSNQSSWKPEWRWSDSETTLARTHLVLPAGRDAGLPLDGVVPDLRQLLVLGHGVVGPGDADRVRGQRYGLDSYWGDHGSAGVWHGSWEFIKEVEKVVL